mgnify:CR=1 FL=1
MATVNIHEAKTHFSKLLNRVESGEEIVIAKAGKPIAMLTPLVGKMTKRVPGTAKGRVIIKKGFMEPLPTAILDEFEK